MPISLWRALALVCATIALAVVLADAVDWQQYTDEHIEIASSIANGYETLAGVTGAPEATGGLQAGDLIKPHGRDWASRDLVSTWPAGTVIAWDVRRGSQSFHTTTVVSPPTLDDAIFAEMVNAIRFAMLAVAMIVALRRPDEPAARALATFLIAFGAAAFTVPAWLPDGLLDGVAPFKGILIVLGVGYATLFACLFPRPATGGLRAAIRHAAIPVTAALMVVFYAVIQLRKTTLLPRATVETAAAIAENATYVMLAAMVVALAIGAFTARGPDRRRVLWATGSVLAGFSGVVVFIAVLLVFHQVPEWLRYIQLTLLLTPIGLAYTILRHRTIDIGFVVSRALVLTTMSFIVVALFGLLERALGKLFIDASHIASRTVELVLALGLGFSLRTLHARVERIVDQLFFRRRQLALAELRAFAADVGFITDPDVAIERTVEIVARCTDAANAALFLIADGVFGRAAALDPAGFPTEIGKNDPLLVRLRSARKPERPRGLGSGLEAEIAFPMFVRGTLVGALILAAKRSGETYDPDECALLADLAPRVALALDALQTIALRREMEAVLAATGGVKRAL
jgi:hypothetical protein